MKLSSLRIISEKREKDFNKLGVFDGDDLIRFYPRAYLDLTERSSLRTAYHNDMALVVCEVVQVAPVNYMSRLKTVKAYCNQDCRSRWCGSISRMCGTGSKRANISFTAEFKTNTDRCPWSIPRLSRSIKITV